MSEVQATPRPDLTANRLESYYNFECEAGPLRNCIEWRELRAAIDRLRAMAEAGERLVEVAGAIVKHAEFRTKVHGGYRDAISEVAECELAQAIADFEAASKERPGVGKP